MSQISLIGFATGKSINKVAKSGGNMAKFQENYKVSKDSKDSWCLKNTVESSGYDIHHSHLAIVGDENSDFGGEIPFRNEVEQYASEKFGIPMLQFVFGGGQNTVSTVLGFLTSPKAFSCIVKGSGRFCNAIEQCTGRDWELQESFKDRTGWLLHTSQYKDDNTILPSNHDFGQIQTILRNQQK
jgi:hypothetical protein